MPGLSNPSSVALPCHLQPLSTQRAHSVFILNAYLQRLGKRPGPVCHRWFSRWLATGLTTEDDLYLWLRAQKGQLESRPRLFANACKLASDWHRQGIWAAVREPFPDTPAGAPAGQCPQVLFGLKGNVRQPLWAAFFNSRKGRHIHPDDEWLAVFRRTLPRIAEHADGIASSLGTAFYDLVTVCTQKIDLPLLLVAPDAIEHAVEGKLSLVFARDCRPEWLLTCQSRAMDCSKATRMVCRDRLLADFADFHYILEIRPRGNLLAVLREQQRSRPRPQWIHSTPRKTAQNSGNFQLLDEFPQWAHVIAAGNRRGSAVKPNSDTPPAPAGTKTLLPAIAWQDYLYHYTRSCPGPWPGESYRNYLLNLFHNDPLSAHTALDTLIRILCEGRIRAGCNLVRGRQPVISWTARSPLELQKLRRWNRALIRWTFEPFGLAVSRRVLRHHGAQPAIYTTAENYARLHSRYRFRFQRHEPERGSSWKIEREWRLPKDFTLESLVPTEGFIFVADRAARRTVESHLEYTLPIVVLQDFDTFRPARR